jgi:hypothetical protein
MDRGVRIADLELPPKVVDRQEPFVEEPFGGHREVPIIDWISDQNRTAIALHQARMLQSTSSSDLRPTYRPCRPIAAGMDRASRVPSIQRRPIGSRNEEGRFEKFAGGGEHRDSRCSHAVGGKP